MPNSVEAELNKLNTKLNNMIKKLKRQTYKNRNNAKNRLTEPKGRVRRMVANIEAKLEAQK